MTYTDVLVVGSGISGLSYALKIAEQCAELKITIITKSSEEESSTKYAQGGVAVVFDHDHDSLEKHIDDTLRAGDGMCKKEVVEMVVKEGPARIQEMIGWGANFDKNRANEYDLGREGGHTENRVIHHKDKTGAELERVLLEKVHGCKNISLLNFHYALDLITNGNTCLGAYVLNIKTGKVLTIAAKTTLLATGGCGHVYKNTTNPLVSTGDGIGLAFRAEAKISNMHFFQFHPTAFYNEGDGQLSLISEAVRGAGAKLLTASGKRFMHQYDEREELASRDIVSRAIDSEMKKEGSRYVLLDCRNIPRDILLTHFPSIYQESKDKGIDMLTDCVPVVPASHYLCGGIDVDSWGQSSVDNLFAVGECSNTGLHGANRLASNSLLEALVYGHRAAMRTVEVLNEKTFDSPTINSSVNPHLYQGMEICEPTTIENLKKDIQRLMSRYVAIVRSNSELLLAKEKEEEIGKILDEIYDQCTPSAELEELRNIRCMAHLIINQSIEQKENRGTFYNIDLDENN